MNVRRPSPTSRHTVPVLIKAIRTLEVIAQRPQEATTKGLALALEISPTTCYRILQSFVSQGWLRMTGAGRFDLSLGLVPVLRRLLRHEVLIEMLQDPLAKLAVATGVTAKLSVRQCDELVTLHAVQPPRPHAIASRVGSSSSLAIGSSGATVLAALQDNEVERILKAAPPESWRYQTRNEVWRRVREARRQGCCFDSGSYQPQIHTVSAPLRTQDRQLVAVITLIGFPSDFAGHARAALARELKLTAGACSQLLEGEPSAEAA